jgi:HEPN domain-containing protein
MSDLEHARLMLAMAEKDLKAIKAMLDTAAFSDEIFGFHAQQAVEKALKSWLSAIGVKYPRIHDLEQLMELLKERVSFPTTLVELKELTDYGVIFRYEMVEKFLEPLDRKNLTDKIQALHDEISRQLLLKR